jgi:hypothetical protein
VPGYLAGRPSRNRGRRYPPDPPRTEEIIAVMRCCGDDVHGARARGLIVVLQAIDPDEIIQTVHARRPPMIPASVGLALPRLH